MEACPCCGNIVDSLDEFTGWCVACSPAIRKDRREELANAIEDYMRVGLPYELARLRVKEDQQAICHSCGGLIVRGTRGRHVFCRANARCRKAARHYRWLRDHYGLSYQDAFQQTLDSLKPQLDLVT